MKQIFPIVIFLIFSGNINSQISHSLVLGPDLGIGANFGNSSKLSIGGGINYILHVSPKIGLRLNAGYNRFNGKFFDDYVSFLPIRAGVQSFIYQNVFFAFADGGVATYKSSNPEPSLTKFSWAAGLGLNKPLNEKGSQLIQTTAWFNFYKHSQYLNYTWFNIRVAYGFSIGGKNKIIKNE
jgi:hypothetical protein